MNWVRLHHDCPTDPQWRVIAKLSGQRIGDVQAVWNFVLCNASANPHDRGTLSGLEPESVAAALDITESDVSSILAQMQGRVLNGERLISWDKRNPLREDDSTPRVRALRQRNVAKRDVTQCNDQMQIQKQTETIQDNLAAAEAVARFPEAAAAITDCFPGTDGVMIAHLVNVSLVVIPDLSDPQLCDALMATLKTKKGTQRSAALWEYTLPEYLKAQARAASSGRPKPAADTSDAPITAKTREEQVSHLRLLLSIQGVPEGQVRNGWQAELDSLLREPVSRKPPLHHNNGTQVKTVAQ